MPSDPDGQHPLAGADALASFIAESPLNICMLDRDGRMLELSLNFVAATGLVREQIKGMRIPELFGDASAPIMAILQGDDVEHPVQFPPERLPMPNGAVHWIQTTLSPWRHADGTVGGAICLSQNMTAEQVALAELGRTQALLDAVIESIPSMISVQEFDTGAHVLVNQAIEEFLGVPREAVVGAPSDKGAFKRLGREVNHRHWESVKAAHQTNAMVAGDEEIPGKSGDTRTLHIRRQVLADHGGGKHVLTVAEDITDKKQADQALQLALEEAEAANLAKSAFLATVSHEIRTPLNGVLGMAQAMERDELPEKQRRRLEVIRQSGESLLAILNDILDLSKVEAGKLDIEEIDFDLAPTIENAAAAFNAVASRKGVGVLVDVGNVAGACRGDPTRVRQMVDNLISNAVKFTETGEVRVTARREGDRVIIKVTDTGPGIAPEVLQRLFHKFVQADTSTTRRFGGTGLGLAICRELAELMGGGVSAESTPGRGSCFTLILPLPPAVAARRPVATELEPDVARDLQILAAEDNPVNQEVLRTIFEQVGLPITVVGDGAEAVEAYRARAWDIILMDVQMPVLDGCDAARAIREIERETGRARTTIIALTANAMEHQRAEYLACGMDRLVSKPLQITELFNAINDAAAAAGEEAEPAQARA